MATNWAVVWGLVDAAIFMSVGVISVCMRLFLKPVKRGFFKDDQSLMYPYHSSTITSHAVYATGFGISLIAIFITEYGYVKYNLVKPFNISNWSPGTKCMIHSFRLIAFLIFGGGSTHFLTNVGKYSIGRLRPHFFDVCKPDWSVVNNTANFIETDICTGSDDDLIQEARLSFPSGHASMSMYCAFFFILYIENRLIWRKLLLLKPFLHAISFSLAFYTCLSRVFDNKHHWSDVLAGGILGISIAFIMVVKWVEFQDERTKVKRAVPEDMPHQYARYPSLTVESCELVDSPVVLLNMQSSGGAPGESHNVQRPSSAPNSTHLA